MRKFVPAFCIVLIAALICAQAVMAYEFVGERLAFNENKLPSPNLGNYVWSADGRFIIEQSMGIFYKIPVDGDDVEVLFDTGDELTTFKFALTPDGSGITYAMRNDEGFFSIFTTDLETLETELVIDSGICPAWSPNGRYLLYVTINSQIQTLMLYDTISNEAEVFGTSDSSTNGYDKFYPAIFDSNSEYVYFYRVYKDKVQDDYPVNGYEIVRKPLAGGDTEVLSDRYESWGGLPCCNFSLTPDSRWLLYQDGSDILLLDVSSSKIYNALTNALHQEFRQSPSGISYNLETGIYTIDDVQVNPETDMYFQYCMPAFSPDGTQFVYYVDSRVVLEQYNYTYLADFIPPDGSKPESPESNDDDALILAVEDNQPEAFATLSNFPNPFNPSTTIEFSLPEAGNAKLVIYDITGRKVRELADGAYSAGTHSIQWDARDDAGNPVSSGVYMSRLTAGDAIVNSRMTFVR